MQHRTEGSLFQLVCKSLPLLSYKAEGYWETCEASMMGIFWRNTLQLKSLTAKKYLFLQKRYIIDIWQSPHVSEPYSRLV